FGAELIGEGDLLRPNEESVSPLLPLTTVWSIVVPTRVAALDLDFERRLVQYPELGGCLIARALQRSKNMSVNMAIVHQARVDVRLHMLLWHLAARWGRVRSDGTVLRLRLTHAVLADLVAARRPTVTTALSELTRRGVLRTDGETWVLSGEAPRDLLALGREADRPAGETASPAE
ncbi:MAG: Crp/Fnr family transcriptional regulator, partial [Solirubrobacterales bacterium]|nr:Crp/Fnr family transcriptional regulator [Solirubrobacterales bacterium]